MPCHLFICHNTTKNAAVVIGFTTYLKWPRTAVLEGVVKAVVDDEVAQNGVELYLKVGPQELHWAMPPLGVFNSIRLVSIPLPVMFHDGGTCGLNTETKKRWVENMKLEPSKNGMQNIQKMKKNVGGKVQLPKIFFVMHFEKKTHLAPSAPASKCLKMQLPTLYSFILVASRCKKMKLLVLYSLSLQSDPTCRVKQNPFNIHLI